MEKKKNHDFLGIRISPEMKKRLTEMAEADGRTLSNFVRRILEKEAKK